MSNTSQLKNKRFKLGTTSFIFPDNIIFNIKKLGAFFDEIELLVFESKPKTILPSKNDIKELLSMSVDLDLSFNVHLPIDISLTCGSLEERQKAKNTIVKIMELFSPLDPTTHTLHLEMPSDIIKDKKQIKKWQDKACQSIDALTRDICDPGIISIETLDYPFFYLEQIIKEFNLSVCIDAGHHVKYGYDLLKTFEKHKSRTPVIHLHGVRSCARNIKKDHESLDNLPDDKLKQVITILENFTGTVSIEVFDRKKLNRSLNLLSGIFKNIVHEL